MMEINWPEKSADRVLMCFQIVFSGYQTAMNLLGMLSIVIFGIKYDIAVISISKIALGILVMTGLAASWLLIDRTSRSDLTRSKFVLFLLWVFLALGISFSPFTGKGVGFFLYK